MDMKDILNWRRDRLREAIDAFWSGNKAAFGRELGFKDGSYVGQMLSGLRPIEEERAIQIEALRPKLKGWFSLPTIRTTDSSPLRGMPLQEPDIFQNVVTPLLSQAVSWELVLREFESLPNQFWVSQLNQSALGDLGPNDSVEFQKGNEAQAGDFVIIRTSSGQYLLRRYLEIEPGVFRAEGGAGHAPLHSANDGIVVVAYAVRVLKSIRRGASS